MNIEKMLVKILQIYNNIDNISDLYDICKKYDYVGTIDDFVYEIKKIFNDYNIIENSEIDIKEELQASGGHNNIPKQLTAGFLAGLIGIPSGFSVKYNKPNDHKKSIFSTTSQSRKNDTTFSLTNTQSNRNGKTFSSTTKKPSIYDKFFGKSIYNFVNAGDLKPFGYSFLALSVSGVLLVLFLINYISRAKSLEEGLNAFIGILNQKENLSEQNLIDACKNLQPLIVAKMKKLGIPITDNIALHGIGQIKQEIELLKDKEGNPFYQKVLEEIQAFLDYRSDILKRQGETIRDSRGYDQEEHRCDRQASLAVFPRSENKDQHEDQTVDIYDGIQHRWVKIVNGYELYDDSKPFLAQVIFDLKFHKDFEDWKVNEAIRLRNLIVTQTADDGEPLVREIDKATGKPIRKFLGNSKLAGSLDRYADALKTKTLHYVYKDHGLTQRLVMKGGEECTGLLDMCVTADWLIRILKKKYKVVLSKESLEKINSYVEQFCDNSWKDPLLNAEKASDYAELLRRTFANPENCEFDDFEKQIVLVTLLTACVSVALDENRNYAKTTEIEQELGLGFLLSIKGIFKEFILGNMSTDKAFSALIEALMNNTTHTEKPPCKRIFRAVDDFVNKIETGQDNFQLLRITNPLCFGRMARGVKGGYEAFCESVMPSEVQWSSARQFLHDKYSKQKTNTSGPQTLLELYYSHLVSLYLNKLPRFEKLEIRDKLLNNYLWCNYGLHDLPEYVRGYSKRFADIKDRPTADAFCYQLISILQFAFTPVIRQCGGGQMDVGNYGLDLMHSLDVLTSVVDPAMNKFMHENADPRDVYTLIIDGLNSEMKKFNCPALISTNDKTFTNLVKALKTGQNSKQYTELIELLTKAYYRNQAEAISEQLTEEQRRQLVGILDLPHKEGDVDDESDVYEDSRLDYVLRHSLHCSQDLMKACNLSPGEAIGIDSFVSAYSSAQPEAKKEVDQLLLSAFVAARPRCTDSSSSAELAKIVFNWPRYSSKFRTQPLPSDLMPKEKENISTMFELIGYVVYHDDYPLEESKGMPNPTPSRYTSIKNILSSWNNNTDGLAETFQSVVDSLKEKVASACDSIDYELLGRCCVALENQDLQKEILGYINGEKSPYILIDDFPPTLNNLYTSLTTSKENLIIAKSLLNITDQETNAVEVIRAILSCSTQVLQELDKALNLNMGNNKCIASMMIRGNSDNARLIRAKVRQLLDIPCSMTSYSREVVPTDVLGSEYLCARVIKDILENIVHPYEVNGEQKQLIDFLTENSVKIPNFAALSDDEVLSLIKRVNTVEIETIKSKVFSILMGDTADARVLDFAESDYFDMVNSYYLGNKTLIQNDSKAVNARGRRYWDKRLSKHGVLDDNTTSAAIWTGNGLEYLYGADETAKLYRKTVGVANVEPNLFQQTVELVMKDESPTSFAPKEKFYNFSPPASPMNPQQLADWYGFPQTSGTLDNGSEYNYPSSVARSKWAKFVDAWCVEPHSKMQWKNTYSTSISSYLTGRLEIFTKPSNLVPYQDVLQNPLVVAMAVFESLAAELGIEDRKTLDELPDQDRREHPLTKLLDSMQLAFMTTDNVCNLEAEDMCVTWKNLIIDTYYDVNRNEESSCEPQADEAEKLIGKICYKTRVKALETMKFNDPVAIHPVYAVEAGKQMAVVYSEALNVHPGSVRSTFDVGSSEACGTAEFVTPVAPNRVRAENASKSLTLGSIIAEASEVTKEESQKDKITIAKIENQTKGKKRSFENLVRVFDDKSLLLKTNELLLSEDQQKKNKILPDDKKTYYFGKPEEFNESWTLRSRLKKLIENLDKFFKNRNPILTDDAQHVLSNIKNYDPQTLREFVTASVMKEFNIDEAMRSSYIQYRELTNAISEKDAELKNPTKAIEYVEHIRKDLDHVKSLPDDTSFQRPDPELEAIIGKYVSNDEKSTLDKKTLITAIQQILTEEEIKLPEYHKQQSKLNQQMQSLEQEKASLETILTDEKRKNIENAKERIEENLEDLTISIVHVLSNKIKTQQDMTLQELSFFLKLCVDIYDDDSGFDGTVVVSECKLDNFGNIFTTDILPLYLVDSGYIG